MKPYYEDDLVTLHHGDCLDVLRELPDASVDSIVTDPPYGLANTDPAHVAETITRWVNGERDYLPGGAGFMGKAWDAFVPPVAVWDECLRVLKPGGHLLAFAGSRTFDLMALGIRLAGFEVRDSIAWMYGSGFPKSLDVSKAIDKRRDWSLVERLAGEIRRARADAGLSLAEIGQATLAATDGTYGKWYHRGGHMFFETGRSLPSRPEWEQLRHVLPIAPEFAEVYDEAEREVLSEVVREVKGGSWADNAATGRYSIGEKVIRDTAPATPDAEHWQGWGTALKPAFEPVVVARKPLAGTVAANVLAHGTGALNVDGCRTATDEKIAAHHGTKGGGVAFTRGGSGGYSPGDAGQITHTAGRWPANVILDESQAAALDEQAPDTGGSGKASGPSLTGESTSVARGKFNGVEDTPFYGDLGGASRFFYVAKADTSERVRVDGIAHPTVKPLALMRWLVRLVTPPGGTVLEPFAGSGTTVEACLLEGFRCIAIEREADYLPLIVQRIQRRRDPVAAVKAAGDDAGLFDLLPGAAS